jgi:hypothetical protein
VGDGVGEGVGLGVGDGVGDGVGEGVGLGVGDGVGEGVGLGVGDGVGLGVGDGVGLGVGDAVTVGVGVGPAGCTITSPNMNPCASQTKMYVPGVLNRQVPAQPSPAGVAGNGGTGPRMGPAVCVHDVGSAAAKATLWEFVPSG